MKISNSIFFIIVLLSAFNAHAKLYKWVDASGKKHFTDTPPPNVASKEININSTKPTENNSTQINTQYDASSAQLSEENSSSIPTEQELRATATQREKEKEKVCSAGRTSLLAMERSNRVHDASGNRMTSEQKEERKQEIIEKMREYGC